MSMIIRNSTKIVTVRLQSQCEGVL